jgi:hypothetical protein
MISCPEDEDGVQRKNGSDALAMILVVYLDYFRSQIATCTD